MNICGVCQSAPAALTRAAARTIAVPAGAVSVQAPKRPAAVRRLPGS